MIEDQPHQCAVAPCCSIALLHGVWKSEHKPDEDGIRTASACSEAATLHLRLAKQQLNESSKAVECEGSHEGRDTRGIIGLLRILMA